MSHELDHDLIDKDIAMLAVSVNAIAASLRAVKRATKEGKPIDDLARDIRWQLAVLTERCCAISEMGLNDDDPELVAYSQYLINLHSKK